MLSLNEPEALVISSFNADSYNVKHTMFYRHYRLMSGKLRSVTTVFIELKGKKQA